MTRFHRHATKNWALAAPVLISIGYGIHARVLAHAASGQAAAPDVLLDLSSDSRLQLFVVFPTWLIGAALTLSHSHSSQELLRYGNWRAAVFWPLWRCLRTFAYLAIGVIAVWLIVLLGTYSPSDFPDKMATALVSLLAETALVASVLLCCYLVVAIVHLLTGSSVALIMAPIVIWTWGAMSNLGIFPLNSPANASIYLSIGLTAANPWALFVLVSLVLTTVAICWLVANNKDESLTRATTVR
jgi:hypothetical protein